MKFTCEELLQIENCLKVRNLHYLDMMDKHKDDPELKGAFEQLKSLNDTIVEKINNGS